jgi:hypothetical protein
MEVKVIVSVYEDVDYQAAQEFFCTLRATLRSKGLQIPAGVKLSLVCETVADPSSATWHRLVALESNTYRLKSSLFFLGLLASIRELCPTKRASVTVAQPEGHGVSFLGGRLSLSAH